jgi:soluble lytic murein transglycosylase
MKSKLLALILIFSILLSSCNYSLTNAPGDTSGTAVDTPTTPTPTATPTPEARVVLGEAAMNNGDYDTALSQFQVALTSTDSEIAAEAMLGIGRVYYLKQDYTNAAQQLGWLINTVPGGEWRTKAFYFLAKSYEGLGADSQAVDAYQSFLDADPQSPILADILELQGDDLTSVGDNARALTVYQRALNTARPEYQEDLELKIALATSATGDNATATGLFQALYDKTSNINTKSTIDLYIGRIFLSEGKAEEAYNRFQDSVANFPTGSDTYSQLVALVDANQTVDDLKRGMIDYYSGQYGLAVSAFDRYMNANPQHDDLPHYFKALSLYNMGDYAGEVAEWDKLIQDHPNGQYYARAFLEKSTTLKNHLTQYNAAAATLLTFVTVSPDSNEAGDYLYRAARIYEENAQLEDAAKTWERVINEYPASEDAILAQFEAGICYYRLGRYVEAQVLFQKNSLLSAIGPEKARAELWVGKSLDKQDKHAEALNYYQQAVTADPTGYYSIRAAEILNGQAPFPAETSLDLGVNWDKERLDADEWMHSKFNIPADTDLNSPGDLALNIRYLRGNAFWELGLFAEARSEFELLRQDLITDAANSYRLMNHMNELGLNQTAILCARQILDLTGLDQAAFLDQAPAYFNHIRFGTYYRDIIAAAAVENNIDPLVLFSLVRQESFFEADVVSSASAIGLMQIRPATGDEIVADYGWPQVYTSNDLTRPIVSIKLGSHYLTKWFNYFGGNMMAALASYNGGIGNAMSWQELSGTDPDLFLEVIRADETRNYIRNITEYHEIYKQLYSRK